MLKLDRKKFLTALAASLALSMVSGAHAQVTGKPIRLLVGFPAGTAPDIASRIVAKKLGENLQQTVVVENVSGAGGIIAAQQAARAPADGSTLFLNTVSDMSIAPHIYSKLAYKPNEFGLISHLVYADMILVVPNRVPAQNLRDYVGWAKQQKPLFMATFGPGSPAHFGAAIFGNAFDLKPEPVHFRATGDAMTGVLSGEVPGLFVTSSLGTPYVKDGKLKALAVTSPTRMASLPDVPTFSELGYPQAVFASWFGLAAPPNTPAATLNRLSAEAQKVMQAPDVRRELEAAGFRVTGTSREEFAKIVRDEHEHWGKAARSTGFKAD